MITVHDAETGTIPKKPLGDTVNRFVELSATGPVTITRRCGITAITDKEVTEVVGVSLVGQGLGF